MEVLASQRLIRLAHFSSHWPHFMIRDPHLPLQSGCIDVQHSSLRLICRTAFGEITDIKSHNVFSSGPTEPSKHS